MANLTYAQKQRVARRTADITKLQQQYARSVEDYTASVGTKETAFKAEMDKYNAAYEPWQQKASAYQTKLSDYQKQLQTYQNTPETVVYDKIRWAKGSPSSGYFYLWSDLSKPSSGEPPRYTLKPGQEFVNTNSAAPDYGMVVTKGGLTMPKEPTEKFTEPAPVAPSALDISAEKAKLQGEKDYTAREVDERTKARLRAVQRGNSRPMMSAGANLTKAA